MHVFHKSLALAGLLALVAGCALQDPVAPLAEPEEIAAVQASAAMAGAADAPVKRDLPPICSDKAFVSGLPLQAQEAILTHACLKR